MNNIILEILIQTILIIILNKFLWTHWLWQKPTRWICLLKCIKRIIPSLLLAPTTNVKWTERKRNSSEFKSYWEVCSEYSWLHDIEELSIDSVTCNAMLPFMLTFRRVSDGIIKLLTHLNRHEYRDIICWNIILHLLFMIIREVNEYINIYIAWFRDVQIIFIYVIRWKMFSFGFNFRWFNAK